MPRLSPMTEFALAAQVHESALNLERLSCAIARMRDPNVDSTQIAHQLDTLATEIGDRLTTSTSPDRVAASLRAIISSMGFLGSTTDAEELYTDIASSCIDQVLQKRTGLPILLSVLWILIGERLGIPIKGVNYPNHFLICLDLASARIYLDPFAGGEERPAKDLLLRAERSTLNPTSTRAIVTRMLVNIKNLATSSMNWNLALGAIERLQLIAGDDPQQIRDRGLVLLHLERPREAATELHTYLDRIPNALDRAEIEQILHALHEDG